MEVQTKPKMMKEVKIIQESQKQKLLIIQKRKRMKQFNKKIRQKKIEWIFIKNKNK